MWSTGSRHKGFSGCGSQTLEHRLSSCGTRAQLLHGMWVPPQIGDRIGRWILNHWTPGKSCLCLISEMQSHLASELILNEDEALWSLCISLSVNLHMFHHRNSNTSFYGYFPRPCWDVILLMHSVIFLKSEKS